MPTLSQVNSYYVLIIVFLVVFSGFLFSLTYTIYYWLHEQHLLRAKKAPGVDPRDLAVAESIKIVDEARTKAMDLLKEAHIEAKSILDGSENIENSTKELFEQKMRTVADKQMLAFDSIAQDLLNAYQTVLSQEKESSLKTLTDVSTSLKKELTAEVSSFTENLKAVTTGTENAIKEDLKAQFVQLADEMNTLSRNIGALTKEAEDGLRSSLGSQYGLVQNSVSSLSENIKTVTDEAITNVKNNLLEQADKLKNDLTSQSTRIQTEFTEKAENLKSTLDNQSAEFISEVGLARRSFVDTAQQAEIKIKEEMGQQSEEAKQVVQDFSKSLKQAAEETENVIKSEVRTEFEKIKQDLEIYKSTRLTKINDSLKGVLEETARDILGKTMNTKDHEELIMKSLENIKRTTKLNDL